MNPHNATPEVTIEHMTQNEVQVAIDWARIEGWNPGVHDAECFYHADPNGFYAAKLNGEIAATISLVKYSNEFCFEGLYIVKPEYRRKGIGTKLQNFALDLCKDTNLGLDGVVSMQKKYEQYGLKFAYNSTRYAGIAKSEPSTKGGAIKKGDFSEVAAYDNQFFPADRRRFLECWLFQEDATALLMRGKKGGICGYGVIRRCMHGHKVGPLFADDHTIAEELFNGLAATVKGEIMFLDAPQPNDAAAVLAQKKGMQPVFSTVRMHSKETPALPLAKIFGVTSFELG